MDADKLLLNAVQDGIRDGVKSKFNDYNSPLDDLLKKCMEQHNAALKAMLESAIGSCVTDPAFREEISGAVRSHLAKTLVQRFGGEIEKQVNSLKSDPTTRARITLAIEEIVKSKTP